MYLRLFSLISILSLVPFLFAEDDPHAHSVLSGSSAATGIQVHGHWTIRVLDPDGSLVQEVSFENALTSPATLTSLLNGDAVSGGGYVVATNQNAVSSGVGPCNPDCEIGPTGLNAGITFDSSNLTLTLMGTNFETLRMAGSFTVTTTSTIDLVQSWFCVCNGTTNNATQCKASPDSCGVFTSKILGSAVSVTAGQIVQITVDLTFS